MAGRSTFMIGSVAVAMGLLLMAGCRSSTKETAGEGTVAVGKVGLDACFNCHADGSLGRFPSMFGNAGTPNVGWLYSAHGNYQSRDQNSQVVEDLGVYNIGYPSYADLSDGTCESCHDPLADGKRISAIDALYGAEIGRIDRPVIGCETCHGAGGNHFGLGPIPTPKPDSSVCGQCHNETFPDDHLPTYPAGDGIYEDYQASPHSRSIAEPTLVDGSATDVTARCSRCHTEEGVKLYRDGVPGTTGYADLVAFFGDNPIPDVANASPVQCKTCHDVHNQGTKFLAAAATTTTGDQSEQFNTCTTCHQLNKTDGTVLPDAYHDPSVNTFGNLDEVITDNHAAVPGDTRLNSGASAAPLIFVNKGDDRSCTGCHNPHTADTTINKQYIRSGHGDTTADAWIHYDWKLASRQACQRCHTSTGFRSFSDAARAGAVYNPADNNFYGLLAGTSGNTGQLETVYCWACHTTTVGDLRSPGQFVPPNYAVGTADVTNDSATVTGTGTTWSSGNTPVGSVFQVSGDPAAYIVQTVDSATQITLTTTYAGATAAGVGYSITPYILPAGRAISGISGSFVCVSCHAGRETGEYIKSYPGSLATNFGSFNSHYLAAGGVLFRTIGYEYSGLSYSNPAEFTHDTIGVSVAGTGTNGPCAGCHMENAESHLFLPTTRDAATDDITVLTSSPVCDVCHGASASLPAMTPAVLNTLETQYDAALAAFQGTLNTKGICWTSA
ncbi:MAG TPA: hypothetical protein VIL61_02245, partial [Nitrospiria bacterium]